MSSGETARNNYESVRLELIQRIQLRDNVLLAYLGAVGTVLGLALSTSTNLDLLLLIPYFALGASVLLSQHNSVIGSICSFLHLELEPFLKRIGEHAPQWDNSRVSKAYLSESIWLRSVGHFLLIIIPAAAAIVSNRNHIDWSFPMSAMSTLWWTGAVLTIISFLIIAGSYRDRKKVQLVLEKKVEMETEPLEK